MENTSVIQIGTLQAVIGIVVFLVGIGIAWGSLKTLVKAMSKTLDEEIKPDLKNIRERFSATAEKVDTLWKDRYAPAHSPRQLNDRGNEILNGSGVKEIIEQKKDFLLEKLKAKEIKNPYDAETETLKLVMELPNLCPDKVEELKTGAFKTGVDINTVLLVGGYHFRDLIFKELGFDLTDLDKPKKTS